LEDHVLRNNLPQAVRVLRSDDLAASVATHAARQRAIFDDACRAHSESNQPSRIRPRKLRKLNLCPSTPAKFYIRSTPTSFRPASTTKLLTEGTVLAKLGADYRFHTASIAPRPSTKRASSKATSSLVASGDPNLSNRIRPDGTLAFVDEDHSYNGPAVEGDPSP